MNFWQRSLIACALGGVLVTSLNASAITINETFDGQYAEDGAPRRGINLDLIKIGPELYAAFATGFLYGVDGSQLWFADTDGQVRPGDTTLEFEINRPTGGMPFGAGAGMVSDNVIGTLEMEINTCDDATVTVTSSELGNATFTVSRTAGGVIPPRAAGVTPDQCAYQEPFDGCPAASDGPGGLPRTCIWSGTLTGDVTFQNNALHVLNGPVFVGEDADEGGQSATLTIEPGTRIVGGSGNDFLGVQRGSKIFSMGQPFAPVVMSGIKASDDPTVDAGEWGGLVINGRAPLNICAEDVDFADCTDEGEGGSGTFGGNDPTDSSGVIQYTRVQWAGFQINQEDELNGIAFQGTGSGTVVHHVQVHDNQDDGVEFFGGTTNAKYILLTDIQDDSLDWTHGWRGNLQYVAVRQNQDEAATQVGRGIEADNFEDANDSTPRAQPSLANLTWIGAGDPSDPGDNTGLLFRRGTGFNVTNAIVTGFPACLDLDNSATFTNAGSPGNLTGNATIQNTIFDCDASFVNEDEDSFALSSFFGNQTGNAEGDPGLDGLFPANGFAPRGFPIDRGLDDSNPDTDGPVFPDFFDNADYRGAFGSQSTAWTAGWTEFID